MLLFIAFLMHIVVVKFYILLLLMNVIINIVYVQSTRIYNFGVHDVETHMVNIYKIFIYHQSFPARAISSIIHQLH